MAAAPVFNSLSAHTGCLLVSLPALSTCKPSLPSLPFPPKRLGPLYVAPSSFLSLRRSRAPFSPLVSVAKTSDWARQEEEGELEVEDLVWQQEEGEEAQARLSEWQGEGQAEATEEEEERGLVAEREPGVDDGVAEEESYPEPPEEAKLFVGNLPYDVDSEKLAQLFEKAGIVEISEVIYNRETDQSRGFGFVTMSTVEQAEKAVEMLHRCDCNGRLLTVNKAAPRGSRPASREYEPSCRIYVGNLPWQVDDARLQQVFSEHGKVVDARVVFDRETGRSRGFGFVTMSSQNELDDAIAALDGQSLDGRAIRVNVAEERPRRGSF